MKRVVSILLTILSALYYSPCFAQEIIAKPMPFFSDLTSNEIWDIFQDNTGYLWIGTSNGVARYDGYHLQSFRNDYRSPHLLTDNHISDFAENEQYVWIGTRKGLNLYDRKTFQMQPVPDKELCQKNIECIVSARNKQVWVASEGIVYRCDSLGNILQSYHMREVLKTKSTSPVINSIYEDKVDIHKMYTRITKDREGNLWLGSYDMANLVSFDHSGIRHYSVPQL